MKITLTLVTAEHNIPTYDSYSNYCHTSHVIGIFSNQQDMDSAIKSFKSKTNKDLIQYLKITTKEYIMDHAY